jgi:hypothetical protein
MKSVNNETIRITDIICLRGDFAYFDKTFIELAQIISIKLLSNTFFNKMFSEVISFCSERRMIDVHSMSKSTETYQYLLESKFLVFEQKVIERHLSLPVSEDKLAQEVSVLDIGIEFDKRMHELDNTISNTTSNYQSELSLNESFEKIVELL